MCVKACAYYVYVSVATSDLTYAAILPLIYIDTRNNGLYYIYAYIDKYLLYIRVCMHVLRMSIDVCVYILWLDV